MDTIRSRAICLKLINSLIICTINTNKKRRITKQLKIKWQCRISSNHWTNRRLTKTTNQESRRWIPQISKNWIKRSRAHSMMRQLRIRSLLSVSIFSTSLITLVSKINLIGTALFTFQTNMQKSLKVRELSSRPLSLCNQVWLEKAVSTISHHFFRGMIWIIKVNSKLNIQRSRGRTLIIWKIDNKRRRLNSKCLRR